MGKKLLSLTTWKEKRKAKRK
ncbi:hypothetical protein CCACVL1_02117, partial [Corchorus capsularis]